MSRSCSGFIPIKVYILIDIYATRIVSFTNFFSRKIYCATDLHTCFLGIIREAEDGIYFSRNAKEKYLFFTCESQHESGEEEDEARTGTPGYPGRLHLFSDSGAQGDACKRRSRPPTRYWPMYALGTRSSFLYLYLSFSPWISSRCGRPRPSASKRHDESTHAESHPRPFFPTRGCCGYPSYHLHAVSASCEQSNFSFC